MKKELLQDWTKIFIDTGALLELYKSKGSNPDNRAQFVGRLFDYLSQSQSSKGDRTFYLSPITLSEILTIETGEDKIRKAVDALHNSNLEFVPFDEEIASQLNADLWEYLGRDKLNEIARQQGTQESKLAIAREIINKDLMIIGSSKFKECDIILTGDKNFYSLAFSTGVYCAYCDERYFDISGKYITRYNHPLSEKELGSIRHVLK